MKKQSLKTRLRTLCDNDYQFEETLKLLPALKKAVGDKNKGKIYVRVDSVSSSGMSRTISMAMVKDGKIVNLNYTPFAKVYGDWVKRGRVRISGCGMDMLFEATYRLYNFLFDQNKRPYQQNLVQYSDY